ncbi:hypothetical protein [Arthrobacter cheniae]|nr:hypothetical protein [Arthrobacter cheniae]
MLDFPFQAAARGYASQRIGVRPGLVVPAVVAWSRPSSRAKAREG